MLKIKLVQDDHPFSELAYRYWAVDSAGNWLEKVDALSVSFNIPKYKLPQQVQQISTAYFVGAVCNCGSEFIVRNRNEFKERLTGKKTNTCDPCLQKEKELFLKKRQEAERKALDQIERFLKKRMQNKYDFHNITFIDAVYCQVILYAAGVTVDLEFGPISRLFITPDNQGRYSIFEHLLRKGIIQIGLSSPPCAFKFEDNIGLSWEVVDEDNIGFSMDQVNWRISESDLCVSLDDYLREIISHPDAESLSSLWHEVALQECKAYFHERCKYYSFNWEFTTTLKAAIEYALKFYSIPQVWNHIYQVAQNLAARVQARTYNRKHIEHMFPGDLRRRVDKCVANAWVVKPWGRRAYEKESYLTGFLFDTLLGGGDNDWQTITASNISARSAEVAAKS